MTKFIGPFTWAWIIMIGALMITPEFIICIKCGFIITKLIGVISIVLGTAGFIINRHGMSVSR